MKVYSIMTIVVALAISMQAELVGSLHLPYTGGYITNDIQSIKNIKTRVSGGDVSTCGRIEGDFSLLAGHTVGQDGYNGADIQTRYSAATTLHDLGRYDNIEGRGIAVWDFNFSGIVSNAWELKVDFKDRRASDTIPDEWYISFSGLGRTLDTTDITTLAPGAGQGLLSDVSKYIKIGELPVGVAAGIYTWDLTEIIEAAQANGGTVRLVYSCAGYHDNINLLNDSGLIATNTTSGTPVEFSYFFLQDDFEIGTASSTNGVLTNGWAALSDNMSPSQEKKEYNVASSGVLDLRDEISPELVGGEPVGLFDSVFINFENIALTNDGDWLELSIDLGFYEDTSGELIADQGEPLALLTLVDSGRTNAAGYGFSMRKGAYHSLSLYGGPLTYPVSISGSDTSRTTLATDGTMQTWFLRIERSGDNFLITPSIDGKLFGPTSAFVEAFTNSAAIDAVFDQLTLTVRGNDVAVKIDNVTLLSNTKPYVLSAYEQWVADCGLSGSNAEMGSNPDNDALDNTGEYIFGGNPLDNADVGTLPAFDAASGNYIYMLRSDNTLTAHVLTRTNLIYGSWITNASMNITLNDGGMTSYTNRVGLTADQLFIKLLVE
ncbi:hypothetical protein [Tichowtungia aerotolerans]|uniref:Uncharacterized protein n=1 Tax=Tichowtungia aerotolerans TaxID=2697043 RepID=A0A6P1MDG8_9BACT|nr:hypothetical protein [Tichowtungia aerotolerans]QHI70118.1 hypothetical protein GT409_11915 [Tichowtungia aerotolerans]